jgi:hypothetical protein
MMESLSPCLRSPTAPQKCSTEQKPDDDSNHHQKKKPPLPASSIRTDRKITPPTHPTCTVSTEPHRQHNNPILQQPCQPWVPDLTNIELNAESNTTTADMPQDGHNHANMKGS